MFPPSLPPACPASGFPARALLWLAEHGQQNQLGAHPRATGLDAAALDSAHSSAAPALSVLPATHEMVLVAIAGTSVLTHMTSTKALQPRSLENPCLRQCPGLARLRRQLQFSPPERCSEPSRPTRAAQSTNKAQAAPTMHCLVDRSKQADLHRPCTAWLTALNKRIVLQKCKSKRQESNTGLVQPRIALTLLRFAQSVKAILFSLGLG